MWLKTPGESDGCTRTLPAGGQCPRFDQDCEGSDSVGTGAGEPRAPEAGLWFDYQVKMLARNANLHMEAPGALNSLWHIGSLDALSAPAHRITRPPLPSPSPPPSTRHTPQNSPCPLMRLSPPSSSLRDRYFTSSTIHEHDAIVGVSASDEKAASSSWSVRTAERSPSSLLEQASQLGGDDAFELLQSLTWKPPSAAQAHTHGPDDRSKDAFGSTWFKAQASLAAELTLALLVVIGIVHMIRRVDGDRSARQTRRPQRRRSCSGKKMEPYNIVSADFDSNDEDSPDEESRHSGRSKCSSGKSGASGRSHHRPGLD